MASPSCRGSTNWPKLCRGSPGGTTTSRAPTPWMAPESELPREEPHVLPPAAYPGASTYSTASCSSHWRLDINIDLSSLASSS